MSGPFGSQQWMYNASSGFYPYELDNSLKFEDGDNSYLSRTPTSAGNRKTWTFSAWFKRGNITNDTHTIWRAYGTSGSTGDYIQLMSDDTMSLSSYSGGYQWRLRTSAVFRDTSSWYHIVVSIDTTQSTSSDRAKLYVNGEQATAFSVETYPSSSYDTYTNTASAHYIGHRPDVTDQFDGYLAEINFIDGTALDPTSFGETKEGIWIPKDPTGLTYGTNGFRLPFKETTSANGFNTVTYSGTGATQSIDGVGFQPDFIWIKERSSTSSHILSDTVRGATKYLESDTTDAEGTASNIVTSFDADGFTTGNSGATNQSGQTYVGWCWGGGTNDKTYTVTVVDDSGNKYRFDGHGTSSITLELTEGATYTFNYPSAHPLRFSTTSDGTHGGGSEYTTGVTHVSYTQTTFTVPSGAPTLYYYCSQHSGMGGQVNTNTTDGPTHAEGTILSRVKPNADYGFSIVSYTGGQASDFTIGHGLSSTPKLVITKGRNGTNDWGVYYTVNGTNTNYMTLNSSNAQGTNNGPLTGGAYMIISASTLEIASTAFANGQSSMIAYCFADVTGYQKIGTYSGTGSSGNAVTTGFRPAFLMIKNTTTIQHWVVHDSTRSPSTFDDSLLWSTSQAENTVSGDITFTDTGFTLDGTANITNGSGDTYIYLAIADTRDALFTSDASGNGNNWTPNDLQHSDVMPDTPTDGFATWNAVDPHPSGFLMSEGNLKLVRSTASSDLTATINIPSSGAYYFEVLWNGVGADTLIGLGQFVHQYRKDGKIYNNNSLLGTYATYTSGDIIGVGVNADNDLISFYKNGTLIHSFTGSVTSADLSVYTYMTTGASQIANFGQDSSFNGTKIPQGNADDNGKGDFYYAPPSGYLALCNANLPDPAIDPNAGENPENYFNTVLYTGTGSSQSITGVGFQPDWTWIKRRDSTASHNLHDSVRGVNQQLNTDSTNAESTNSNFSSFDSDGFTVISGGGYNGSSNTYAAWNWLAGGTGVTNDDGSITSTVSANTEAGFSIVSYTGNGTGGATVGHGLSVAPSVLIVKNRDSTRDWAFYHEYLGGTKNLYLNTGNAAITSSSRWNDTDPTSTVFSIGTSVATNTSGEDYICYCFSEKEGYSKFGGYTGTGSTDGPFLYTGFRPAWVLIKNASATEAWQLIDSERSPHNVANAVLYPNSSAAESNPLTAANTDFLSNGIKIRGAGGNTNDSGLTYIYMAFAEQPFKYSNAR